MVSVLAEVWLAEATAIVSVFDVGSEVHAGWANFWGANATAPLLAPERAWCAFCRFANASAAVRVVDLGFRTCACWLIAATFTFLAIEIIIIY